MEGDLRLDLAHPGRDAFTVPNVDRLGVLGTDERVQARRRRGLERQAVHFRAEPLEPELQPGALEAGVPRDEHPASPPDRRVHQIFQGARPESQSSSSWSRSHAVSIGCQ